MYIIVGVICRYNKVEATPTNRIGQRMNEVAKKVTTSNSKDSYSTTGLHTTR